MSKPRPVNLDLGTISLPVTAKASILHRISGVFLVAAIAVGARVVFAVSAVLIIAAGFWLW